MNKFLEIFLGILTAMGGFVEIGELTFTLNAGSKFQYQLVWVALLGTVGIMIYGEMAGRVAAVKHQGIFGVIRERVGMRAGLLTMVAANLVCLLTCAAEIGAIAMLWQLLGGWPVRLLIVLVLVFFLLVVWLLKFKWIERVFGLGGLLMVVFMVLAWRLHPDWSEVIAGAIPRMPVVSHPHDGILFAYYAVALLSSIMLPYETYFYAAGAIEDKWKPKDVAINRVIVIVGFALGGLLSLSLIIVGNEYYGKAEVTALLPGTALLAVGERIGRTGVLLAMLGMLFAFAGAAIETALSAAYNLAQFFGWPWGKFRAPRTAVRFVASWVVVFALAALIVLTGVDPIAVVEYSIVFSVVILPLTYFPLLLVAGDKSAMGEHANGRISATLGWAYFILVSLAALAAIPLLIATRGGAG